MASPGIAYSALRLTSGAWNEASPRFVLHTGAHQGSLGTRIALGFILRTGALQESLE